MLIVCTGPDTFRARQKYAEMILGYKLKYDKEGASIEKLDGVTDLYQVVMDRLSNQSLFSQKKMVVCDGLSAKLTAALAKKLDKALISDADQTIVVDFADKGLKAPVKKSFSKKSFLLYEFEEAKGAALNKEVARLCQKYKLNQTLVPSLIQEYGADLWAIDTALQVAAVIPEVKMIMESEGKSLNIFELVDALLVNKNWQNQVDRFDVNEIIMRLLSQIRSWMMIRDGGDVQLHPFVKSKLSRMNIQNPEERMLQALQALVGMRSSLVKDEEAVIFLS